MHTAYKREVYNQNNKVLTYKYSKFEHLPLPIDRNIDTKKKKKKKKFIKKMNPKEYKIYYKK